MIPSRSRLPTLPPFSCHPAINSSRPIHPSLWPLYHLPGFIVLDWIYHLGMARESSGFIELLLPALAWVNSDMAELGGLEWKFDIRPSQYLFQISIMPRVPPKSTPTRSPYVRPVTPVASRVTSLSRVPSTTRVVSTSRVPSTTRVVSTSCVPSTTCVGSTSCASSTTCVGSISHVPLALGCGGSTPNPISPLELTTYAGGNIQRVDGQATTLRAKRHRSDVYLYYDEAQPSLDPRKGPDTKCYRCLHCGVNHQITGSPNSNLHKHRRVCPGLTLAWHNHAPGSIAPDEDPVAAAERKKELRTLLIGAIISKNLPFSIFSGNLMQQALRAIAPGFYWPGRMAVKADSMTLFLDLEKKLIDEIASVPGAISTATDCWTSADFSHTYMAINGFFFDAEGNFCRRLLAFKTLEGKHTGENLAKVYWKALEHIGAVRNHFSVTGDNASSNRSMVQILANQYAKIGIKWPFESRFHGCMCHVINLVARDFLDGMGELTEEEVEAFETSGMAQTRLSFEPDELPWTDDDERAELIATSLAESNLSQASLKVHGPTQEADFDISQATYEDIVNNQSHIDESPTVATSTRKKKSSVVSRIRALDTHIRKSPQELEAFIKIRDSVNDRQLLPLSCPPTRWNYFYYVVKRTLALKKSLQLYTSDPKRAKVAISNADWSTIEYMLPILEMFETATQFFQSNDPTKHLVLPVLWALQKVLKTNQNVLGAWGNSCKRAEDKLLKYLIREESNHQTLIATILDPVQRDIIFRNTVTLEHKAVRCLRDEYDLWKPSPTESGHQSPPPVYTQSASKKLEAIYSLLGTSTIDPSINPSQETDEVRRYLLREDPVLPNETMGQFWMRMSKPGGLPVLAQIALQHLTIAASGASVERVFSISGNIAVPSRGRLDTEVICRLVLIRHWLTNQDATVKVM